MQYAQLELSLSDLNPWTAELHYSTTGAAVQTCEVRPHLQVALVGVENDGLVPVEDPLHLQGQSANGRLEVGLLGVHHQPHAVLQSVLRERKLLFHSHVPRVHCGRAARVA